MDNYRLKKEAVQFFLEEHSTAIYSMDTWKSIQVDIKALEKVEPAYLEYGIKTSPNSTRLCGWCGEKGGDFEFIIHFPSMKYKEYDNFKKGNIMRDLMDKIQTQVNYFYQSFANNETD